LIDGDLAADAAEANLAIDEFNVSGCVPTGVPKPRFRPSVAGTFTGREARAAFTSLLARSATLAVVPFVLARVFAGDDAGVAACVREP